MFFYTNNHGVIGLIRDLELEGYNVGRWDSCEFDGETIFRPNKNLKELCENGVAHQFAADSTVKYILNCFGEKAAARRVLNVKEVKNLENELGLER